MEDQGIMALPQAGMQAPTTYPAGDAAVAAFEQMRQEVDPAEFNNELMNTAEQADPASVQEFKQALQGLNLPPEVIDALGKMVDIILSEPQNYAAIRQELVSAGVPEDILPPEFDAAYFGAMNMALDQLSAQVSMPAPQAFAAGGMAMKPIPAGLASLGRGEDTMIAHITPSESRMLRRYGGRGSINPVTGLREYGLKKAFKSAVGAVTSVVSSAAKAVGSVVSGAAKAVSSAVKSVASAVKKFAASKIGRIVTTVALGFFLGPAAAGALGITSAAGVAAMSGFIGSAGATLLGGGNIKSALKSGVIGGLTAGATAGVMGGTNSFESGSYTGPKTISGQVERFTEGLKSLGAPAGAPTEVTGRLDYTGTGDVIPGAGRPVMPTGTAMEAFDASNIAPQVTAPPAVAPQAISTPEFVATAPGAGTQVAGTAQGIGPVPGTPTGEATGAFDAGQFTRSDVGLPQESNIFDSAVKTGKEFFFPPQDLAAQQAKAAQYGLQTNNPSAPGYAFGKDISPAVQKEILSAGQPMFGTTSRMVGAGLGALALSGGFKPKQEPPPGIIPRTTGFDLYNQNPELYGVTPGGANVTYAPPNISPGYGFSTYEPSSPSYGQVGSPYFAPQFRVRNPNEYLSQGIAAYAPRRFNVGGFAMGGGIRTLAQRYPRRNGAVSGPGTETSDEIPAMLSDGEFVMTAKAVRGAGAGSRRDGAKRMYQMMRKFERNA